MFDHPQSLLQDRFEGTGLVTHDLVAGRNVLFFSKPEVIALRSAWPWAPWSVSNIHILHQRPAGTQHWHNVLGAWTATMLPYLVLTNGNFETTCVLLSTTVSFVAEIVVRQLKPHLTREKASQTLDQLFGSLTEGREAQSPVLGSHFRVNTVHRL